MELHNETKLGDFLAHIHASIRRLAFLRLEQQAHPAYIPDGSPAIATAIVECWNILCEDLPKVLGPEAEIKSIGELSTPSGAFYTAQCMSSAKNPFHITLGQLKVKADKYRQRKYPELRLLKSWDLKAKQRPKQDCLR